MHFGNGYRYAESIDLEKFTAVETECLINAFLAMVHRTLAHLHELFKKVTVIGSEVTAPPHGPALVLLNVIEHNPQAVIEALSS